MRRMFSLILLIGVLTLIVLPANATVLLQEDFSSATIANGSINDLSDIVAHTWYDFPNDNDPRWQIITDSGGQHIAILTPPTTGDYTHILFTAVDASGLGIGTELTLNFEYKFTQPSTGARAFAYLIGLTFPGDDLDPFAPWLDDAAGGFGSPDLDDGTVLHRENLTIGADDWVSSTLPSVTLSQEFSAIGVAFVFGDGEAVMAVDNVYLEASVPEPSIMLLLGTGLVSLAGLRRKFRN